MAGFTRVDISMLTPTVDAAIEDVRMASSRLTELLGHLRLNAAQRKTLVRPSRVFPKAARQLAQASLDHPELVAAVKYDREALLEDLAVAEALQPLQQELTELSQLLNDAVLRSLHEAYLASAGLYTVSKAVAGSNPQAEEIVSALKPVFEVSASTSTKKESAA